LDAGRRLSVQEAADQLGITVDAVRGRIKRGTIEYVREGDRVWVILEGDESHTGRNRPTDQYGESAALISQLRDENAYLRDENRRKDEIIMQQAMTMRQLAAAPPKEEPTEPTEPAETAETVEEEPERAEPRPSTAAPQTPLGRRLWRRVFGG
jgi:excisionase family DNA binding protein